MSILEKPQPALVSRLALGLFRVALLSFPRGFRHRYGKDMEALLVDQISDIWAARPGGLGAAALFVLQALANTVSEGLDQRRVDLARRSRTRSSDESQFLDPLPSIPGGPGPRTVPGTQEIPVLERLFHNLRFAYRSLRRSPGFAALAILTLAFGIGANTAFFSVVDGVLLEPLPYAEPSKLVRIFEENPSYSQFPVAPGNLLDYRRAESFEGVAAFTRADAELSGGSGAERLSGMRVSSGFLTLLGATPSLGRDISLEDEQSGQTHVAIISDELWATRFGRDPATLGQSLILDGEAHAVIGVAPAGLEHIGGTYRTLPQGTRIHVWRPLGRGEGDLPRHQHFLNVIARLDKDAELELASNELTVISSRLEKEYPESNTDWRAYAIPLREEIVGESGTLLWLLLGSVGLVLLVVCANIANLTLARGLGRRGEIAIRGALGASRRRILAELLTESLLLALVAGVFAAGIAFGAVELIRSFGPATLPRLHSIELDRSVLAFNLLLSIATGILFGCLPALRLSRISIEQALRTQGRSAVGGQTFGGMRSLLVAGQVAFAVILLSSATLLVKSLSNLAAEEPGFASDHVVTASINLPSARYQDNRAIGAFWPKLLEGARDLPGVRAVGAGSDLPWTGYDENMGIAPEGGRGPAEEMIGTRFHHATPGYFAALGVPLLAGRTFDDRDHGDAPRRLVINASLARTAFPESEEQGFSAVVGRRMTWSREPTAEDWFTVIGVVGNIRDRPGGEEAGPGLYFSYSQMVWTRTLYLVARTAGDEGAVVSALRSHLRSLDPDLPLAEVVTLDAVAAKPLAEPRFASSLVGLFSLVALAIAVLGLASVIAYSVSQRRREVAMRMALGASRGNILRLFLGQSLPTLVAGVGLGVVGAILCGRWLRSLLFGVNTADPTILMSISAILILVGLGACLFPALQAARIEPSKALRGN